MGWVRVRGVISAYAEMTPPGVMKWGESFQPVTVFSA